MHPRTTEARGLPSYLSISHLSRPIPTPLPLGSWTTSGLLGHHHLASLGHPRRGICRTSRPCPPPGEQTATACEPSLFLMHGIGRQRSATRSVTGSRGWARDHKGGCEGVPPRRIVCAPPPRSPRCWCARGLIPRARPATVARLGFPAPAILDGQLASLPKEAFSTLANVVMFCCLSSESVSNVR